MRLPGESIAMFVAELRKLSEFCNYGEMLNDMLRDRLVCGINNVAMQRRLLSESKLTLERALELAQGMEAADQSSKAMHDGEQKTMNAPVNRVHYKKSNDAKSGDQFCYCCGGKHSPQSCHFKEVQCHSCKISGHIAKVCKSNPKRRKEFKKTHHIGEKEEEETTPPPVFPEKDESYTLFNVTTENARPIRVSVSLNGKWLKWSWILEQLCH